jgi:hypothetical protein
VETGVGLVRYALNVEDEPVREDWPPRYRIELVRKALGRLGPIGAAE